jgi:branched-chain amino acid transport system substrate-binding protein
MGRLINLAAALALVTTTPAVAADPGVTATEITIGQNMAYSGPASAYGAFGKSEAAYFRMTNDNGGVHGRKIKFISLDDGYSPPKTIEQIRRLVEEDNVFLIFASQGTAPSVVIRKYLNDHKVPQVFATSGIASFGDHRLATNLRDRRPGFHQIHPQGKTRGEDRDPVSKR